MNRWIIVTQNGEREWLADDAEHAIEQHEDAHADQEGEAVIAVLRAD